MKYCSSTLKLEYNKHTSSSDDCPPPSSSDDHVHSPVIVLCNRPDVPGCLFDAYNKQVTNNFDI